MKHILVIIGAFSVGLVALSSPLQSATETANVARTADQSSNVIPGFKVFAFYDGNVSKLVTNHQLPIVQQGNLETVDTGKLLKPQFSKLAEVHNTSPKTDKKSQSQQNPQLNRQKSQYDNSFSWPLPSQKQQVDKPITNFQSFDYGNSQQGGRDISSNELPNSKWFQQKPTSGAFSGVNPNQQTIIIRPNVMYDDSYIFNSPTIKQQNTMYSDNPLADVDRNFPKIQNPLSRPADYGPFKTSAPDYIVNSVSHDNTLTNFDEPSDSYHFLADTSVKPDVIDFSNGKHQQDNDDDFITNPTSFKHFLPSGNDKQQNSQDFQNNVYKSPPNYASVGSGEQITDKGNAWKRPSPNYHSDLDNAQQKSGNDCGFTGNSKQYNNYFVANNDDKADTEDGAIWTDDNPSVGVGTHQPDEHKKHNIFQHNEPSTDYASTEDGKLKPPQNDNDFLKKTKSSDDYDSFSDDGQQQLGDEYSYVETPEHGDDSSYPVSNIEKPHSDDYNTFSEDNKPSTVDHSSTGDNKSGSNEGHYYKYYQKNTKPSTNSASAGAEKSHDHAVVWNPQQSDYFSSQQNNEPINENPQNRPTNVNSEDKLTDGNLQGQNTKENPQNQSTNGNQKSQQTNGNLQSQPNNENPENQPTNGNPQNQSTKLNSQNEPTNGNLQIQPTNRNPQNRPTNVNSQDQLTNGNSQSQETNGNPQSQPTNGNPQNQPVNLNSQNQPTNGNPQNQTANGNPQNQTANGNPQNQQNAKTGSQLTPLQLIAQVVNDYLVKPVSNLLSG